MAAKNPRAALLATAPIMQIDRCKLHKLAQQPQLDESQFLTQLEQAQLRYQARLAEMPKQIEYPPQLPVVEKKAELYAAIRDHQVVIIAGETGSGKTTQIPKICLELGRGVNGFIGHTQPRRLAARSVAARLAQELNSELGQLVGYKVRFSDHVAEQSLVKLMTDGILLTEIQHDRLLWQYDTIIIDEAHERSLNIDFILGYLKQILPRRPDLKVIITSATIDPQRFAQHFEQAPIIEVSGRTYPVEVRYRPLGLEANDDQLQGIIRAVDELSHEAPGDILVFLSGEREIRDAADALSKQNLRHTEILPLYARLSAAEQNRIFQPSSSLRRIILATNVAETSLTVPGIKYVIDTGLARISRYSYRTKVQRLPIEPISQASANQRKGRCGRTSDGICIRLYDEQDFLSRPEFTDPEIVRTNLASVILQMMSLGLGKIEDFPFVEAPDYRHIQDGLRLLEELGAIEVAKQQRRLTKLGQRLAQLPLDPRLARMILAAQQLGCVHEVMIITAALSIQDPRERPLDKQQAADEKHRRFQDEQSDFLTMLNLWHYLREQQQQLSNNQFRKLCRQEFLNYLRIREWQDVYTQLRQTVKLLQMPINQIAADYRTIHCALLSGLLSQIGMKEQDRNEYLGARNIKFAIFPNSALFKKAPKWCVVAELVETGRLWGRFAAKIEPEWLEALAKHLTKSSYSEPRWSKKQGVAVANEKVTLFGLPIVAERRINFSHIDPKLSRELFIRHALVQGEWQGRYPFYQQNRQLLAEVEELEHKSRRRDIVVDEQQLFDFYDQRIAPEVVSVRHFDQWWKKISRQQPELLNFEKQMLLRQDAAQISRLDYPDFWQQNALKLPLTYQFEPGTAADGVTVHIPLSILNQVSEQGFDWQVPGLRLELVTTLIKSLPKSLRRNFVPAPNYAEAFLERAQPGKMPLINSLSDELRKMTGVTVEAEQWPVAELPNHLRITFHIVDQHGKTLAQSKDLAELKQQLSGELQQVIQSLAQQDNQFEQDNLTDWQFGELPQTYQQQQGQFTLQAYPALVDHGKSVSIELVDNPQTQQQQSLQGLRRLLLLNMPSPIKYLHEKLPNKAKLSLYFTPFGTVQSLIDDCIACAVDYLIAENGGMIWQQAQFLPLLEKVKAESNETTEQVARKVELILNEHFQIQKRLKGRVDLALAFALSDIKAQLANLIYPGFVTQTGYSRLDDLLRYLRAITQRIEKLLRDPNRDRANLHKVQQVEQAYQQFLSKLNPEQKLQPAVTAIRWMIEELRVNLFAQQLGTPYPISDKRILNQISAVAENLG